MNNVPRILLIDHVPDNVQVIVKFLTGIGFDVVSASSATQAIDFVESTLPDLILLNVDITGSNGFNLCRQLKELSPSSFYPIILITEQDDIRTKVAGFGAGADDYIARPFYLEELASRIRSLLRIKSKHDVIFQDLQKLQSQSILDEVTGLYNKKYFLEKLPMESARRRRYGQHYSIILLNVDHFTAMSDKMGADFGKQILAQMSDLLVETIRQTDILARYEGDIFAILVTHTKIALPLAERIRSKVEQNNFEFEDKIVRMTVSIGICGVPATEDIAPEKALDLALGVLNDAKKAGRNRIEVVQTTRDGEHLVF